MALTRHTPVVAGVDGSTVGLQAARWAVRDAQLRGLDLLLVGVDTLMTAMAGTIGGGAMPQSLFDAAKADNERVLREAADDVAGLAPDVEVITQARMGNAAAELIECSRAARLLVVGTRGHGEVTGLLVGSVARALVGHAHSSVLVVGEEDVDSSALRLGNVVVGIDGSAPGERALKEGFAEAEARQTALKAVHSPHGATRAAKVSEQDDEARSAAENFLDEHVGPWQEIHPDVPVQKIVGDEPPAQSLGHHGRDAQMLVVGSRGRGGFAGLLLGSVSHALLHTAPCPLMVAR